MNRPHSAHQGPKKIYLGNKGKDKNANPQEYLPSIQYKQQNNYNIKEDVFNEELSLLQASWDELGITPEYRAVFINLAKRVSNSEKKDIFMQEKINLKKFRDSLLNLKKEIANRENNLAMLHVIDKKLETVINTENKANSIDNILQEAVNIIKTLRMNAVNIVSKIIKVNQISAYYSNSGKFDTSRIKPEYFYDHRYLFKMKEDLLFLKNSALSTFIEMNNSEIDAFLTNCAPVPNKIGSSQKIKIPIADDLMKLITESRYALLQETVLANIDKEDMININPKNDFYEENLRRGSSGKNFRNIEEEKYRYNPNRPFIINNNSAKKKNSFFQSKNMSKYIYDLKNINGGNRYNYLFYNNNSKPVNKRLGSAKRKLFNNYVSQNYNVGKRINIEHDIIESQTHEQFLKKLNGYKSPDKNKNAELNSEAERMILEDNEVLKDENKRYQTELNEMKMKIQELEEKLKEETSKRENFQNKNKELSQKIKGYIEEIEKNSKIKRKKENELNSKIEQLQKEKDKNLKENKDDKQKYEKEKNEMGKIKEELLEKIKNLENKLKNEENEKAKREEKINELEKNLKDEKDEREKERLKREEEDKEREEKDKIREENDKKREEEEQKNMEKEYEEKKLQAEEKKKLEEEINNKNNIIKEKEEENNKIILEKSLIEDEKIKLKNELDKLKEENAKHQEEINRLKEENSRMIEAEEQRKKLEEEEKLKKAEEEERKRREEEEERKRKEEEERKRQEEEEERKRKEEEERLKREEEERKRQEEEDKDSLILLRDKLENGKEKEKIEEKEVLREEEKFEEKKVKEEKVEKEEKEEEEKEVLREEEKKEEEEKEVLKKEKIIGEKKEINTEDDKIEIPEENKNNQTRVKYYNENISNLTNTITDNITLDLIPDFLKRAFLLNELIYEDDYYFKGTFPKIIVSTKGEEDNIKNIKGLCSFYYENNENLKENIIVRINCIFAIDDDYEEQITLMIDFIKKNVKYNRIELYLLYDKEGDKFIPNKEAKDLFQKKLGYKWLCVVRDEKLQQRYIKLYLDNDSDDEKQKDIENTQNNFIMNNLTIISINNEDNAYSLKNIINDRSKENRLNKKNYNKFINPGPIYSLLLDNPRIKKDLNEKRANEIKEMKEKLWRFITLENGWNSIEDDKKKIKDLHCDIKDSIYDEIEKYLLSKELKCFCDLCQTNLSINFETNYSILIDEIYYNRISSDKIKVLKEKRTKSTFFLIPSNDNTTFFYVTQVNKKLKELLMDNEINIYEKFLEFQPSTQKELFDFSVTSYRDITYIPQTFKKAAKTIYIPAFSINSHLFSYNFKDIGKNISMTDQETNTKSFLTSVDEFLNIEFLPDNNLKNSFTVVPVEGGTSDFIIKDSFIIGIFDNDIINNEKLPLLQFLYVTKDHFIWKKNEE